MKNLTAKISVLLCLITFPVLVLADGRSDGYGGTHSVIGNVNNLEWSLRGGYEILYKVRGSKRWLTAPGSAIAVADGWVLGTDRHRGGYGIYRWNGWGWSRMPGEAVRIGGSYQQPWVINESGLRFVWNGYQWRETGFVSRKDVNRLLDNHTGRGRESYREDRNNFSQNKHRYESNTFRKDSRENDRVGSRPDKRDNERNSSRQNSRDNERNTSRQDSRDNESTGSRRDNHVNEHTVGKLQ